MGWSDPEFGLETGPVRGLADPELAYYSSLGLDPNWFDKPRVRTKDWTRHGLGRPGIQSKDWVQHGFDTPRAWTEDLVPRSSMEN